MVNPGFQELGTCGDGPKKVKEGTIYVSVWLSRTYKKYICTYIYIYIYVYIDVVSLHFFHRCMA